MNETILKIAETAGTNQATAQRVLNSLRQQVAAAIAGGRSLDITGFGKFYAYPQRKRQAKNPRTQDSVIVPPKLVPKFSFSISFKKEIQPELEEIEKMLSDEETENGAALQSQIAAASPSSPPQLVPAGDVPPPPPPVSEQSYWVSRNGANPVQMVKSAILPDDMVYQPDRKGYVAGSSF